MKVKKLKLVWMVLLVFGISVLHAQEVPFQVVFSVTDASCYNNGKIAYALVDTFGNALEALPEGLSQVRAYYKLSASDTAHYVGWYYTGGTDTMTINSGNYIVGVEGLLAEGDGFVRVDTHLVMVVGTTYQKPEVSALYNTPIRYQNAGLIPSVSCLNTGRVQLWIQKGRFPYTVTICDHVTGDTLRTDVFDDHQFNGTNLDYYNYKDYYSFDSMPAGNWDFFLVDGCGYGYPRINQNVASAELPRMKEVHIYASTGHFIDSNVVNVVMELDRDASLFDDLMEQHVSYRLVYDGLWEGEWKKLPSHGVLVTIYDTLQNVGRYCDIIDRDITLEYKLSLCLDTVYRKTFRYYRPNPQFFQKDTANIQDSTGFAQDPCVYLRYWHRHYYSIRYYSDLFDDEVYRPRRLTANHDHMYYRYHYTHPLTWEYTDLERGTVIKRDTVATIVDFSHLYDRDVEAIYGSFRDTTITIPVERKLLDAKGCVLYTTIDTMTFYHCVNQVSNCWGLYHSGNDHCCQEMREVSVQSGYLPKVDPDGTIVRLVISPYNNRYNFEAVYHSDSESWQVVKEGVENTALVSGANNGCSLALRDYCLPSGPYVFEIITPCDSFTVSDQISFPDILRTEVLEEPSYTIIRECANIYLKYTNGVMLNRKYNTSPETGLPVEGSQQVPMYVQVVGGPSGGYDTRRYTFGETIRISLPGTYVFKIFPSPYVELCESPVFYDTVLFNESTVEFEYAFALLCDSSSTSGNAYVLGSNGVKPYTYTLYDHPDKQGDVLAVNNSGIFLDVPMRSDQEMSCLVEDSCHAYFHVNFYPRALADLQKIWFDGGLTVQNACEGSTIQVHALSIGDVLQYEWSGPNGFHSYSSDPYVFVPREAEGGWYKVIIHNNSCSQILMDSIFLVLQVSPKVILEQDTVVCPGQPVELHFTPYSPEQDSVVFFTIAFSNKEGIETRQYSALSGVTVTDTFVTITDAKIYPIWINDGRCDYPLTDPDDTLYIRMRTDIPGACTITTTYDTVCHGGDARLFARSDMDLPYTLRWYGDYELSHLLKTDIIQDSATWSSYDTGGIVQRTVLFAAVEKEGMCPTVNGLYSNTMNMHDGTTELECGQIVRLFDSGGADGDYPTNEYLVHHFVSSDGKPVAVQFEEMMLSNTSHLLVVSGQELTADSVLYEFVAGVDLPGILVSKGNTLTLFFISGEVSAAGWRALVEQAPGVAIAIPLKPNSVSLQDEVCQRQSGYYEDPYGISPDVAAYEELSEAVKQSGTYTFIQTLEGADVHGCDSTVTFTLVVNPPAEAVVLYDTTMASDLPYTSKIDEHFADLDVSTPCDTIIHRYLQSVDGCDSVVVLNLTVVEGQPVILPCDSTIYDTLYYVVMPTVIMDDEVTVACFSFHEVTRPGVYSQNDTLVSVNGCDSVLTVYLIVEAIVRDTVCESVYLEAGTWERYTEYYEWNGNSIESLVSDEYGYYEFPGQLILNGVTIDTITYLSLTLKPTGTSTDELNLCLNGDVYTTDYNGLVSVTVSADGNVTVSSLRPDEVEVMSGTAEDNTFILRMTTESGCDSILTLTVNYEYVRQETLNKDTIYAGEAYTVVFSNHEFTVNGPGVQTYTETVAGSNGCDSIITIQLTVHQMGEGDTTAVACESFTWYGEVYTTSGEYTKTLTDVSGRDSLVTLHLTINHGTSGDTTAVVCGNFTWHGVTYTESGDYPYYTTNARDCDSVVTLHLTINHGTSGDTAAVTCGNYTWHGITYTESGDYQFHTTSAQDCDSVVTLHLTINHGTSGDTTAVACGNFTWHGVTYTESGDYQYHTTTALGCDSVVTLHLTINHGTSGDTTAVVCGNFTWHGVTYTESGDYPYYTTNARDCDSVVTLHLTINHGTSGDTTVVACENFTWHGVTYTESGDYPYYTTNARDCDSVVTLHLTINHGSSGDTTAVFCGNFTWHGVTYTESGDYPYYTTNALGCDSLVTLHLTVNHLAIQEISKTDEVCGDDGSVAVAAEGREPIQYSIDGIIYQSSNVFNNLSDGSYTVYAIDANGCEATMNVTIAPAPIVVLDLTCPPTHHDTLAYGDCVMEIYPEAFGTPTATIYPAEWPFEITNDIPADHLYYEGVAMITYTMTDLVCGNTATCSDSVVVVFPQCPDAVDCEGNVYHGVRIGCDCWTQTNLLSNCYGSPNECMGSGECEDPIPCVYEYESESFPNVEQNVDIYGRLYCAEAALNDSVVNEHGHIQGICPEGWYLPTPEQYEQLYLYGGGTSILTANGLRSPLYWLDGGGDNATGFSALPAGYYNGALQRYERMMLDTYFWATEVIHGEVHSTAYKITYDCSEVQRTDVHSGYGISVRCVKEKD